MLRSERRQHGGRLLVRCCPSLQYRCCPIEPNLAATMPRSRHASSSAIISEAGGEMANAAANDEFFAYIKALEDRIASLEIERAPQPPPLPRHNSQVAAVFLLFSVCKRIDFIAVATWRIWPQ